MRRLFNGAIDILHDGSLPTIELLQSSFPNNEQLMINISTLLDPRYVFLIYAPILFALNKRVGHRMIIALTLAEWANQILKWLLAGERPYWYVYERAEKDSTQQMPANSSSWAPNAQFALFDDSRRAPALAQLRQFPVTCELGAGSPSGHAMVAASVWYVLIDAHLKGQLGLPGSRWRPLVPLAWLSYVLMLLSVSLSRVYLACHFPHQCLGGALLGLLVAWLACERLNLERLARGHFCLATMVMFSSALGLYTLLGSLGLDPLWSVEKAVRWCAKKEYIHLDTTPFFSMMRYIGFCLGAGLAFDSERVRQPQKSRSRPTFGHSRQLILVRRLVTALASIMFGQFLLALPAPKTNLNLFYLISFINYTLFSYAIAGPIPNWVKQTLTPSRIKTQ